MLSAPELDWRSSAVRSGSVRDSLHLFRAVVPVMLVVAGTGATLAWMGFLGWKAFELLRWAVG